MTSEQNRKAKYVVYYHEATDELVVVLYDFRAFDYRSENSREVFLLGLDDLHLNYEYVGIL